MKNIKLVTEMIKKQMNEAENNPRENFMNVNQHKELNKLLDGVQRICSQYLRGNTKTEAMDKINYLYSLTEN